MKVGHFYTTLKIVVWLSTCEAFLTVGTLFVSSVSQSMVSDALQSVLVNVSRFDSQTWSFTFCTTIAANHQHFLSCIASYLTT